jgi:hypothetical protein
MGDVYANAACTIAATAARNSSEGLFFERIPQLHVPRVLEFNFDEKADWLKEKVSGFPLVGNYLCDVHYLAQSCVERAPLSKRAWVCQERQLSRRILHFTSTQLFWECQECMACETYPDNLPPWAQAFWRWDATSLKNRVCKIMHQNKDDLSDSSNPWLSAKALDKATYFEWLTFRDQYASCVLTHPADKLVAINGIARWISRATGDELVAGLWLGHIIEELCWRRIKEKSRRREEQLYWHRENLVSQTKIWRAPTWSWACQDDGINRSLLTKFHMNHETRHAEAELVEIKVEAKTSGGLERASMSIRSRPLQATFTAWAGHEIPLRDDTRCFGTLRLVDSREEHPGVLQEFSGPDMEFHLDRQDTYLGTGQPDPQYGYIVVLQQCVHGQHSKADRKTGASENQGGEINGKEEKADGKESVEAIENPKISWVESDSAEALFLQTRDNITFERAGLIQFGGSNAVGRILEAHYIAEERVITLV